MCMNLKFTWAHRLGNFLMAIKNAIQIALYYNYNIIFPTHPFLNTTYLVINKNVTIEDKKITDVTNFFLIEGIKNIDKSLFQINVNESNMILKDIFAINNVNSLGNNDLVLHIRSGDIFQDKNPHPVYVTPPLSYYKNIIEHTNYETLYLIAEDTVNPCINILLELYPKIIFKKQNLEEDVKIVLSAVNIVISFGTFLPALLDLSTNIKTVYCPSFFQYGNPKCITHITDLDEYHKLMVPWKNSPEQIEIMLNY